jgi:hypothetical protein
MRSLRRGATAATFIGGLLLVAASIGPRFAPRSAPIPEGIHHLALALTLVLTVGSGFAWVCFRYTPTLERGVKAGFGVMVAMMTLLIVVGCTAGYAVAARDILSPYQEAAEAARADASSGMPVVYFNIVPRRPSMLYYGGYSPYEHKEPGLLPFLRAALPHWPSPVDLVLSRSSYQRLLLPELATAPYLQATILADYGRSGGDWLLVRLQPLTGAPK